MKRATIANTFEVATALTLGIAPKAKAQVINML